MCFNKASCQKAVQVGRKPCGPVERDLIGGMRPSGMCQKTHSKEKNSPKVVILTAILFSQTT